MADATVGILQDGSPDRLIDNESVVIGADTVYRQRVQIPDVSPVSSDNSTTTPLSGSGTWTGTGIDVTDYVEITMSMYAEPSNASGTMYFDFSSDGTNWDVSIPITVSNPTIQVPIPLRVVNQYFRARYVNDGTAQTAFRFQTMLHRSASKMITRALDTAILTTEPVEVTRAILTGQSPAGSYVNVMTTNGNALVTDDFLNEVALGNVSGYSIVEKFGRNGDIDIGTPEDVWIGGGDYTGQPVSDSELVEVLSSDANDTSAGTGARTLTIVGLDENYDEQTETITLSGTTPVDSAGTYRRVFRAYVATAGSGGENAGTITIRHTTTTANVFATIGAGYNQTQVAAYTIPNNKTGYLRGLYISNALASGGNGSAQVSLRVREPSGVYRARRSFEITQASQVNLDLTGVLSLPEHTDIKLRVDSVSDNNTIVNGEFTILLVDD